MKTNHRRGYKAPNFKNGMRSSGYVTFQGHRDTIDGHRINAFSTVAMGNSESVRRDRAGAKKFIHSRARTRDKDYCSKLVTTQDFGHDD